MKIDPNRIYVRDSALPRTLAAASGKGEENAEAKVSFTDSFQPGLTPLSLGRALEELMTVLSRLSSGPAKMLSQCVREMNSLLKTLEGDKNLSAAQIKTMVRLLKIVPFLKQELVRLSDAVRGEKGTASQRAAMNRLAEQFARYESLQDMFDEQGVFIFSLPGRTAKKKEVEIALYKEGKKRNQCQARFSLMLDVETAFLGKVTLWAGVEGRTVRLNARVMNDTVRQRLEKGAGSLKKDLARDFLELDNLEVKIRQKAADQSVDAAREFIA